MGRNRWRQRGAAPTERGWTVFARSTTVHARPDTIDAAIAQARDEVLPAISTMDGCIGLSMMVDRESGRCIVTTAWETEEAMHGTQELVRPLRERAVEIAGAPAAQVDEWEIAVMHRDHQAPEGACVRSGWMQVDPAQIDRALDVYRLVSVPGMEQLEGFCSASLLVDRATGKAVSSVTLDSREAMEATRDLGARLRESGGREAGATFSDVAEFELALAHLHVPEMA